MKRLLTFGFLALIGFVLLALMIPYVGRAREVAVRTYCKNNLKQIGLALHSYHEAWHSFPPAYVADEDGRPMHSWRVLILPYIDQARLYNLYRFDEPWDGPNNRLLHDTILDVFNCPSETLALKDKHSTNTNYVVVVGPESMWPGSIAVKIGDITDGTSNTLMVVETANSGIHWMEPRDLHVLQMAPSINSPGGQGISSTHTGGAHGLLADASVRFLSESLPVEKIGTLLTRRGGEKVDEF